MPSRVWLNHLVNICIERSADRSQNGWITPTDGVRAAYELGQIPSCLWANEFELTEAGPRQESTMNHVTHCLRMALETIGASNDEARDAILLLATSAYAIGLFDEGAELISILEAKSEQRLKKFNDLGARIGKAFLRGIPLNVDALPEHPFLHLRRHGELSLFQRIAQTVFNGLGNPGNLPDRDEVYVHLGWAQTRLHRAISASISLAYVDGIVDGEERDLIQALIEAARFDDTERAMLLAEFEQPMEIGQLVHPPVVGIERRFLFRLLFLGVHINGRYHPKEQWFLESLAREIGDSKEQLANDEDYALVTFEANYALLNRLTPKSLLAQVRQRMIERAEEVIRRNTKRLNEEIAETKELVELLRIATRRPLTSDEENKVKAQILDFARAIPALAIFAAPGGLILWPILTRYLGIHLAPSSFVDEAPLGRRENTGRSDDT